MTKTATKEVDKFEHARANAHAWLQSIQEMVRALERVDGEDFSSEKIDDARDNITASVLCVTVRDGWRQAGAASEGAEEYEILLSTGGPALRIWGKIGQHDEPETAELQMQDWFLPWTEYVWKSKSIEEKLLLTFARQFYFGG